MIRNQWLTFTRNRWLTLYRSIYSKRSTHLWSYR